MCESRSDFFKNWTKSFNLIWDHIGNTCRKLFISPCSPPPLAQSKYLEHNCIFVNYILYQNVMFGQGGEGCQKARKPINGLIYYLQCTKAIEIYCICMFYLNEQTICPILTGTLIKNTLIMHINILCKICFSMFNGLCFI